MFIYMYQKGCMCMCSDSLPGIVKMALKDVLVLGNTTAAKVLEKNLPQHCAVICSAHPISLSTTRLYLVVGA
jgi:uracil DNA glycosylase